MGVINSARVNAIRPERSTFHDTLRDNVLDARYCVRRSTIKSTKAHVIVETSLLSWKDHRCPLFHTPTWMLFDTGDDRPCNSGLTRHIMNCCIKIALMCCPCRFFRADAVFLFFLPIPPVRLVYKIIMRDNNLRYLLITYFVCDFRFYTITHSCPSYESVTC